MASQFYLFRYRNGNYTPSRYLRSGLNHRTVHGFSTAGPEALCL